MSQTSEAGNISEDQASAGAPDGTGEEAAKDLPERADCQVISPPNMLRPKVGTGGLEENVLQRAEQTITKRESEFPELADTHLIKLRRALNDAQDGDAKAFHQVFQAALELKSSGGMFQFKAISRIAQNLCRFSGAADPGDPRVLPAMEEHYNAMRLILSAQMVGDGGTHGNTLVHELRELTRKIVG